MREITFNLLSSCVSRDVFTLSEQNAVSGNIEYKVIKYSNLVSPISIFSPSAIKNKTDFLALEKEYLSSNKKIANFWFRCIQRELEKNAFDFIGSQKSDCLIIDNSFARFSYLELENGSLVIDYERDYLNFLIKNKIIYPIKRRVLFRQFNLKTIEERIKRYSDTLLSLYNAEKIIIQHEIPAALKYDSKKNEIIPFEKSMIEILRSQMEMVNFLTVKYLKTSPIIPAPKFIMCDFNHIWGPHPLHYQSGYYTYAMKCINSIVTEKNNIDYERSLEKHRMQFNLSYLSKYVRNLENKILS